MLWEGAVFFNGRAAEGARGVFFRRRKRKMCIGRWAPWARMEAFGFRPTGPTKAPPPAGTRWPSSGRCKIKALILTTKLLRTGAKTSFRADSRTRRLPG